MPVVFDVRVNVFPAEHGFPSNTTTGEPCSWEAQPCFFLSPKRGGRVWAGVSGPSGDGEPSEARDKACAARAGCCPHQKHHGHRWTPHSHGRWEQLAPTTAPWWRTRSQPLWYNWQGTTFRQQSQWPGMQIWFTRPAKSSSLKPVNQRAPLQLPLPGGWQKAAKQVQLLPLWAQITDGCWVPEWINKALMSNSCFFGFGLSLQILKQLWALGGFLSSQGIWSEPSTCKEEITNTDFLLRTACTTVNALQTLWPLPSCLMRA